jgi:hypothetical protein
MANNPYRPPTADVTEPADRLADPVSIPRNVILGLAILAALVLYSLYRLDVGTRLNMLSDAKRTTPAVVLLAPLAGPALQSLLIGFAFWRLNWARVTLAVLFGLSVLAAAVSEYALPRLLPAAALHEPGLLASAIYLGVFAIRGGAVGLLFTPTANAWFRRGRD